MWCLSIQTTVVIVLPETVVLQNVQHPGHLAEDEDPGVLGLQTRQQLVQQHHLASVVHQMLVCCVWWSCKVYIYHD